ncbi:unnamed protein product [Sympodiomycopsis kandeliae]
MSKHHIAVQKLADQDSNWRRPRSPALNIPSRADTTSAGRPGGTTAPNDSTWSFNTHARHHSNMQSAHRGILNPHHQALSTKRSSSLERSAKDASSANSWRSHHTHGSYDNANTKSVMVGSLGSHLSQRRHVGFQASSNASEVARRAFVASEIGSIGSTGKSPSHSIQNSHREGAERGRPGQLPASVSLRPLRVEGFDAKSIATHDSSVHANAKVHSDDWACTPTSSLPSLPSSPGRQEDPLGEPKIHDKLFSPRHDEVLAKRVESHALLTGEGSPNDMRHTQTKDSVSAVSSNRQELTTSSPVRAPRAPRQTHTPLDRIAAQNRMPNSSPRRASDILSRFRQTLDAPQSPRTLESPNSLSVQGGTSSPALPPSRRDSVLSLASHRHGLQHSRRDSLSSQFSSPSVASIASSRPVYGVYRPPHLRNRDSTNGLQAAVAHYDRVSTPSLRGMVRSPEPPSRPASTVPGGTFLGPGIPEESQFSTPLAKEPANESAPGFETPDDLRRTKHQEGYFDLPPASRLNSRSPVLSNVSSLGSPMVEVSEREDHKSLEDDDDFDLTHDEMLQTKTSLTDSYCLSRRSSMLSNFQIGNGVPVVDIFQVGDRLGPGMIHDGYPITIAETSNGFSRQQSDVTGTRLEVLSKLGEGSYAVVYLVQEVAGAGQVIVGSKDDVGNFTQRGQPIAHSQAEEEADATVGDITIAGTLLARGQASRTGATSEGDEYSSTLRAAANKPRDSFATRAAAADEADRINAERQDEADEHPPGIDEPQEGRMFALKCLCKRDLSDDMLEIQRLEATIHQSIPPHRNIVTLYRTYETPEWLFLVLEYCPGQDLFYWLEQARDTDSRDVARSKAVQASLPPGKPALRGDQSPDGTPPSPSLLASTSIDSLLSRKRLRLISKMFRQMCDAVQFCHDRGVAHRDIKPENFIVEDRREARDDDGDDDVESLAESESTSRDCADAVTRSSIASRPRPSSRRISSASFSTNRSNDSSTPAATASADVVVKLTDFGLATAERYCQDFDCGSKPYMAYECRNNITSSYDSQQADVWSLGIVFLNLIFHRSPFREPHLERCESFAAYCYDPVGFLLESFEGLTEEIAVFLNEKVLCNIIPSLQEVEQGQKPSTKRISAREFGRWAKTLPERFGLQFHETRKRLTRGYSLDLTSPLMHSRAGSNSSVLPSLLSSPRPLESNLVIEEDDDHGYGQHSLFPEYDAHESQASPTPGGNRFTGRPWLPTGSESTDAPSSPTFPSPPPPKSPVSKGKIATSAVVHSDSPPMDRTRSLDDEVGGIKMNDYTGGGVTLPKLVVHPDDNAGTLRGSSQNVTGNGSADFNFGNWSSYGPGGKWQNENSSDGADGQAVRFKSGGSKLNGQTHIRSPGHKFPVQSSIQGHNDSRHISALAQMLEKERLQDRQRVPSWRAPRERRESRW